MINVSVEIVQTISVSVVVPRSILVTAEIKGVIGQTWAGIDEGNSTTTYTDGITDE